MQSSNSRRHWQRPFPEWIPRCIQDLVQILYNDAKRHNCAKDVEVLDRLTLDPRMKRVWDELLKKKRLSYVKTEQYVHPTASYEPKRFWSFAARSLQSRAGERRKRGEGLEADRVLTRALLLEMEVPNIFNRLRPAEFAPQEQGLIFLFYIAFKFAQETPQSVAVAEARKATLRFRAMAKTIRADVAAQKQRMRDYFDHRLLDAACAYEELADDAAGSLGTVVIVTRKARSEPRLKGFVMALASTTKVLFGVPLYRSVATLTNVALNRSDVTGDKVRKMLS